MVLRIRLTDTDIGQVQVAKRPDPLWELLLAAHMLQTQDAAPVFNTWRREVRTRLSAPSRRLLALAPAQGYSPDFLTPAEAADGLESGLEAIRRTPLSRVHHELHALPPARRNLPWAKALANGAAADLGRLTDGMSLFLQQAVSPYWPAIERQLTADRDRRAGAVLHGGVDHLLATLHPDAVWQPPVLLVRNTPIERDLHLRGRGLKILPSFFCWRHPVVLRDPDLPPVLVLPIEHDPRWVLHTASRKQQQVAALIGRTRAALLEATARSQCTTDLARQIHTSASCTSEHLKVLREAGLITTRREGVAAIHTLSPLGRCLLDGVPQRSD